MLRQADRHTCTYVCVCVFWGRENGKIKAAQDTARLDPRLRLQLFRKKKDKKKKKKKKKTPLPF